MNEAFPHGATPFPEIGATEPPSGSSYRQAWPRPLARIIKAVCSATWEYRGAEYLVTARLLLSPRRPAHIVRVRMAGYWLASTLTQCTLPQIGWSFHRDHSTIIYGVRRCGEIMDREPAFRATVEAIAEELGRR
jgi:chromosomal replication initiation ATPase DnaA